METRTEPRPPQPDGRAASPPPGESVKDTPARRRPPVVAIAIGAVVLIAALIFGIRYLAYASTHETTDDARVDADTVTITSKIAERVRDIKVDTNQPVHTGDVLVQLDDTDERTRVSAAQAGLSAQQAQARAAQAQVALTQQQQQAQNAQGSGGVTSAQAAIQNAVAQQRAAAQQADASRSGIGQAQAQLRAAQDAVPAARAAFQRALADQQRYAALVRTGDIAQQQLDAANAALAGAQAQYSEAQANVAAAQTAVTQAQARYTSALSSASAASAGINANEGQLATAQGRLSEAGATARVPAVEAQAQAASAQLGSLRAQLRQAQDQLGYTVIRSPIDGYVGAKNVEIGATVAPGQALLNLVPNDRLYITANYKETQLGKLHVGQDVEIEVDAYKGTTFHGKVASIAPASQNTFSLVPAQNATGNFVKVTQRVPVRITVENPPPDRPLRVGMSVVTHVRTK